LLAGSVSSRRAAARIGPAGDMSRTPLGLRTVRLRLAFAMLGQFIGKKRNAIKVAALEVLRCRLAQLSFSKANHRQRYCRVERVWRAPRLGRRHSAAISDAAHPAG
jgi:hypothetical protein